MPSLGSSSNSAPTIDYNNSIVEVAQDWGSDNFEVVPYLFCKNMKIALPPDTGHATLDYRCGNIETEDNPGQPDQFDPLQLLGYYVRISIQSPENDPVPVFWGVIEDQETDFMQTDVAAGPQTLRCHSLEYLMDRITLVQSWVTKKQKDSNGNKQDVECAIDSVLPFNRPATRGFVTQGNRSNDVDDNGFYTFSADGNLWSSLDICNYLLGNFGPTGIPFQLTGLTDPLNQTKQYHDFHKHSLWNAISKLIDHRHALTFSMVVNDDDTVNLVVNSLTDFPVAVGGLTIPPNSNLVTFSLPNDGAFAHLVEDLPVRMTNSNTFGTIEIYGAKIKYMGPFVFNSNTVIDADNLVKGWKSSFQAQYDTGAPMGDDDSNRRFRANDIYADVYQKFVVPLDWNGQVNGLNMMPIPLEDGTLSLDPADGNKDAGDPRFALFHKTFDKHLPMKKGVDYTQDPPVDNNFDSAIAEYVPLMVLYYDSDNGEDDPDGDWHYIEKLHDDNEDFKSLVVKKTSKVLGVHIEGHPNHYLGFNHFNGDPNTTDVEPMIDYENFMVVGMFETDSRLVCRWFADQDNGRVYSKIIDSLRYVYAADNCPIGVDSSGNLQNLPNPSQGGVYSFFDDSDILRQIAAELVCFYGVPRQTITITVKQPGLYVDLGAWLTEVDTAFSTEPIGTVINSIEIDFDHQTSTISTGFYELDFVALIDRSEDVGNQGDE